MDVNNMKVTDLKKELKSRGLSIVGNKSELMARLATALSESEQSLDANNGHNSGEDEDNGLEEDDDDHNEEELLGEESVNELSLIKTDDTLIDDLLDPNIETKVSTNTTTKKVVVNRRPIEETTKAGGVCTAEPKKEVVSAGAGVAATTAVNSNSNLLKTSNTIRLSVGQSKELRAQKFGDTKLSVRAQRFGIEAGATAPDPKQSSARTSVDEKLKKRAERFGAIVSEKLKKSEDNQRLDKRKERFASNTTNTKTSIQTLSTNTTNDKNSKRKITFSSTKDDDVKQKRIAKFGAIS